MKVLVIFLTCFGFSLIGYASSNERTTNNFELACYVCEPHRNGTECAEPDKQGLNLTRCYTGSNPQIDLVNTTLACYSAFLNFDHALDPVGIVADRSNDTGIYRGCYYQESDEEFCGWYTQQLAPILNISVVSCGHCYTTGCNLHKFNSDGMMDNGAEIKVVTVFCVLLSVVMGYFI